MLKKFIVRIYTTDEPEDGFNAWVIAENAQRALEKIYREYHSIDRADVIGSSPIK